MNPSWKFLITGNRFRFSETAAVCVTALLSVLALNCSQLGLDKKKDSSTSRNLLLLAAVPKAASLNFSTVVGSQKFACGTAYTVNGTANVKFRDFRFFVTDVKLISSDNTEIPFTLNTDNVWQSNGVALLDFETGSCGSTPSMGSGSAETNSTVTGTVPAGSPSSYKGVKFSISVPTAINFQDSTTQPAPLNVNAMYWSWTSGYKFAKIEFSNDDFSANITNLHLGSTSCVNKVCSKSYRPTISISKSSGTYNPSADTVTFDISAFLSGYAGYSSENSCMPGTNSNCLKIHNALGLDSEGNVSTSITQTAFSIK